jgi:hypothetical protein
MGFTLTFLDEAGGVAWMGGIDCDTGVRAVVDAIKTHREEPRYAAVEIVVAAKLIKRLTRAEVMRDRAALTIGVEEASNRSAGVR